MFAHSACAPCTRTETFGWLALFTMSFSRSTRLDSLGGGKKSSLLDENSEGPPSPRLRRAAFVFYPACQPKLRSSEGWWSQTGSNRRPPACKAGALPTELWPRTLGSEISPRARQSRSRENLVGLGRLERPTSPLSGVRSNHLSYRPEPRRFYASQINASTTGSTESRFPRRVSSVKKEKRRRRRPA